MISLSYHDDRNCFRNGFIRWFKRGGGALCAESEAWTWLEKNFGRMYVPHAADLDILQIIADKTRDPLAGFLLVLVGMPRSGKTQLLRELINGMSYEHFPDGCQGIISKISEKFEFRDIENLHSMEERKKSNDFPRDKRVIWVTTALDDFVDTSISSENALHSLEKRLHAGLGDGESVMIFGNRGILGDVKGINDPVIRQIVLIVASRNSKGTFEFIRVPRESNVFWIKQFGIEHQLFGLTSGLAGFTRYSLALVRLSHKCLDNCVKKAQSNSQCKSCTVEIFLKYILELEKMLQSPDFSNRVHDLLTFVWLKHCDVYLTPRSLNLFWGYFFHILWSTIEDERIVEDDVDKSLIYDAIYLSKIPSMRGPDEYNLSESKLHEYRDEILETIILKNLPKSSLNVTRRRRERLVCYFSNCNHKTMIQDSVLEEYMDDQRLLSIMRKGLLKLVLARPLIISRKKLNEKITQSWSPEKLLLGPLIELSEEKNGKQKARRLLVLIFDDDLYGDISFRGFQIVANDLRYLELREKTLELNLRIRNRRPAGRTPFFNLNLKDYQVIREFASETSEPILDPRSIFRREVQAFLRTLNGVADYSIAPLIHNSLVERARRNNETGLFVHSIKHEKDCIVKISANTLRLSVGEESYLLRIGGNQ